MSYTMVHTFDEALNIGIVKLKNLNPAELIGTFDGIMSCLVSWIEGDSMDHGLLTCLYLYEPSRIEDLALSSFVYATQNIVQQIQTIIEIPNVYGEEDFKRYGPPHTKLFENSITSVKIIEKLKLAQLEWEYETKIRKWYSFEDSMAVQYRLHLIGNFFELCLRFAKFMIIGTEINNFASTIKNNIKNIEDLLPLIKKTTVKGTLPNKIYKMVNSQGFSYQNTKYGAPSDHLMQRLYHRYGVYECIEELMFRIKVAFNVTKLNNLYRILNFCNYYAYIAKDCILSRSILQGLCLNENNDILNVIPLKDFLVNSAISLIAPRVLNYEHPLYTDSTLDTYFNKFIEDIAKGGYLTDTICISGFNFSRQRTYLADVLETLNEAYNKAFSLDNFLLRMAELKEATEQYDLAEDLKQSARFSGWMHFNTFCTIKTYMATGFELELYEVNDYIYIYGYFHNYLFGAMANLLQLADDNLHVEKQYYENPKNMISSKACNIRKPPKFQCQSIKSFKIDIIYYRAFWQMAGGMFKAMIALTKAERIRPRTNDEEQIYNDHFGVLKKLTFLKLLNYEEFQNMITTMMDPPTSEIYDEAAEMFRQTHVELAKLVHPDQDALDLIEIAKYNYKAMTILSEGHQKGSKQEPQFKFKENCYFPKIKLS